MQSFDICEVHDLKWKGDYHDVYCVMGYKTKKLGVFDLFFSAHHHFTFPVDRQVLSVPPVSQQEGRLCYNHVSSNALSDLVSPQ